MRETFYVYGMSCAMCAKKIETKLNSHSGVKARVFLNDGKCIIDYDPSKNSLDDFKNDIKNLGYKTDIPNKRYENIKLIISIVITLYFIYLEFGMHFYNVPDFLMNPYLQLILSTIVVALIGLGFAKRSISDIKNKSLGMDVLVTMGAGCAYLLSIYQLIRGKSELYFPASAMIPTIVSIGKRIEASVKKNTSYTVSELQKNLAVNANVVCYDEDDGEDIIQKNVNSVNIGDTILVKEGDTIPLDGVVIKGIGDINDSILTGEAKTKSIKNGSSVYSGATLVSGTLYIKVTKKNSDTLISKIIEKVEEASISKPPIERITSKIASIFVPCVLLIALVSAIITIFISDFETGIIRFATVVLVSCPCALGLATPMAILIGSNKAAKEGIIFRSGEYLEYSRKINTVVFDKTKTLTVGNMEVKSSNISNDDLVYLVSLEKLSNHPIALSIVEYFKDVKTLPVTSFTNMPGIGIKGIINNLNVQVITNDDNDSEYTSVKLIIDDVDKGYINLSDTIRNDSLPLINNLKDNNITPILMTGDNKATAKSVSKSLGIDKYYASLSPIEKGELVNKLKEESVVGFVGDGVNDAFAITSASVGFAPLDATDTSISASDVIFLKDDLSLVKKTIDISKLVFKIIIENLIFAFIYNVIAIPLACFGILNPVLSSIMMGVSNILVCSNALRIKAKKIK